MRWKGGLGWLPVSPGQSKEADFWIELSRGGKLAGVVYDVGAFEGVMSLFYSKTAKAVVSFEPVAANRRRLVKNLELNLLKPRIMPCALGEGTETLTISSNPLFGGCSSLVHSGESSEGGEAVSVVTMDGLVASGQIPPPDFIKIDVEGFEQPVLRGAMETLQTHRPQVFVELHGDTRAEKRRNATGVLELLEQAGFARVLHVESNRYVRSNEGDDVPCEGHFYADWQA
ncbi:MAG: FkbM family methyltransferase [Terriglobia bacterium]